MWVVFFLNPVYPLFRFTCWSFGKLFVYKNYPLWFILFFCQIWYRIWVWATVHKHERWFYRTCWKKISCSATDANRIFKCTWTDVCHCIYFPYKKKKRLKEKCNLWSERSEKHRHSAETSYSTQTFCEDWTAPKYTDTLFSPGPGTAKVLDLGACSAITAVPRQHRMDVQQHKKRFTMCLPVTAEIQCKSWRREVDFSEIGKKKKLEKVAPAEQKQNEANERNDSEQQDSQQNPEQWNKTNRWNPRVGEWEDSKNHSDKRKTATERFVLVVVWLGTST